MIKQDLVAERVAIETYREMVRYFGEKDPTSRILLERILAPEEEHANDMHDLLVAHEGRPDAGEVVASVIIRIESFRLLPQP